MSQTLLSARQIEKFHGPPQMRTRLLAGIDLRLMAGERVALWGRSGSGKSSLLHILGALDPHFLGSVQVLGHSLRELNDQQRSALRSRTFGFVFQAYNLIGHLTAVQNVMLPAAFAASGVTPADAHALLAAVQMTQRAHHLPRALSGGERQRVAVARALVLRPRILLCDEPTGNLDAHATGLVLDLIEQASAAEVACAIATHDPQVAARCHRVCSLVDGRLIEGRA